MNDVDIIVELIGGSEGIAKKLLFSATITDERATKMSIYNSATNLHNDWRAYNNIACIFLAEENLDEASDWLDKASEINSNQTDILNNYGIF